MPHRLSGVARAALVLLAIVLGLGAAGAQRPAQSSMVYLPLVARPLPQPQTLSVWGMNAYLTKRERLSAGDNTQALGQLARAAGVEWTREELPWDLIEPNDDDFRTVYDASLRRAAEQGFGIIGMLLTTPAWARDGACGGNFWCPPADVGEYAEFAAWMVERYDGDGVADAPGSPRVAYWQIWNEPNDTQLWPDVGGGPDARKRRYGELLVAAYQAIKAADPTAKVVIGGVYIFDGSCTGGVCDGFNFLNAGGGVFQQVPAARQAFDVFAIHPYVPTNRPDAPEIPHIITVQGRVRQARGWLNDPAIGRPDAPIWVTEIGWCTGGDNVFCPGGEAGEVNPETQANYLVRALVIAEQSGAEHVSWFQLEDAFNNPGREWGNAAILERYNGATYPAKPAYTAYSTLAARLAGARPVGPGPVHTHVYDPNNFNGSGGVYNYRYTRGAATVDVLWVPSGGATVSLPVAAGAKVTRVEIDGAAGTPQIVGGAVQLTLSERPIIVVQEP
jgi:hypothetical protein